MLAQRTAESTDLQWRTPHLVVNRSGKGRRNTWEGNMPRGTSQPAGKLQGRSGGPTQRHCTQWYETGETTKVGFYFSY
jgi:hypothetical protein